MGGRRLKIWVFAAAGAALLLALPGCGGVQLIRGPKIGASTDAEARNAPPGDPLTKPVQVAWTSARASYCGFVFNPDQLRAEYLASEQRAGTTPSDMKKIEQAYDYTRNSVLATIKDDPGYCNKDRTDAIRQDLNRYLAGDFTPSAHLAR